MVTGFDLNSAVSAAYPTGAWVRVRPNQYEPGRGHVAVYNWDGQETVAVDLGPIGLAPGEAFEVQPVAHGPGEPQSQGDQNAGEAFHVRSFVEGDYVSIRRTGVFVRSPRPRHRGRGLG